MKLLKIPKITGRKIRNQEQMNRSRVIFLVAGLTVLVLSSSAVIFYLSVHETVSDDVFRTRMKTGSVCSGNIAAPSDNSSPANNASTPLPPPNYQEVIELGFYQNFESLDYNVTAIAQNDSYGYGPAYLLDGVSSSGYWYQVGISWHWHFYGRGYYPGFQFIYQIWAKNETPLYPGNGAGLSNFSTPVNSGDIVLLSLKFNGGNVVMGFYDWNTSARESISFSAFGSSVFIGGPQRSLASMLETEWYHTDANFCSNEKVTFSNFQHPISTAWMCISEQNYTGASSGINKPIVFGLCAGSTTFSFLPLTTVRLQTRILRDLNHLILVELSSIAMRMNS